MKDILMIVNISSAFWSPALLKTGRGAGGKSSDFSCSMKIVIKVSFCSASQNPL